MKLRNTSLTTFYILFVAVAVAVGTTVPPHQSLATDLSSSVLFDSYTNITSSAESRKLNKYARQLQSEESAQGYIITYGGRDSTPDVADERATRAVTYLISSRDIDSSRLTVVLGGYKENPTTELWIRPVGAPEPMPSGTIER